jgi:peptide/nickel transport system permease protein
LRTAFLASWKVRFGLGVLVFFLLLAVFGPWLNHLLGLDPQANDTSAIARPPGGGHPLGTDQFGQDILAQIIAGARGSMYVGLLGAAVSTTIAILVGVPAGYHGGRVDGALTFLTNIFLVMPVLPLIMIVAGYLQGTGLTTIALIIGFFGWPGGARTLRAQSMSIASRDFVRAMRMLGERGRRLVFAEVLPHLSGLIASMFLGAMIGSVMAEAGLAFLGITDPASISWGTLIQSAQQQGAVLRGMWWWFVPPALCIALLGTAAAMINFGVDELANPKLRVARPARTPRRARRLAQAGGNR